MDADDIDGLGDITAAIEAAGGDVKDFETTTVQNSGIAAMMSSALGGDAPTHHHFLLEVCPSGPTTRDIPDPDSAIDADAAARAVAIAHTWAEDEGMDALAADLNEVGQRVADQATGDAHPTDEMTQFDGSSGSDSHQFGLGDRIMYETPMDGDEQRAVVIDHREGGQYDIAMYNTGIGMLSKVSKVPEHRVRKAGTAAQDVGGWADD